jgi:pyrophosphatase PpaX
MTVRIVYNSWIPKMLNCRGITLYPYIFIRFSKNKAKEKHIIHHEWIHAQQIKQMGILKFYSMYGYHYLKNYLKSWNHSEAYHLIPFEQEAYGKMQNFKIPKKTKMIICFDLDGTLVNTEKWIVDAITVALKKHNLKIKKKDLYKQWGVVLRTVLKKTFPKLTKTEIEEIIIDFEKERKNTIHKIKPFKNTKKILKELSKKYTLCILSNNPHSIINKILKIAKIDEKLFSVIIGNDEVKRAKPFPDEIYKAEKELKNKVQFMVGDSKQDIKTAKAAKVKSIIILTSPKQVWKDLKEANYKVKDIKEIPKLIKEVIK